MRKIKIIQKLWNKICKENFITDKIIKMKNITVILKMFNNSHNYNVSSVWCAADPVMIKTKYQLKSISEKMLSKIDLEF